MQTRVQRAGTMPVTDHSINRSIEQDNAGFSRLEPLAQRRNLMACEMCYKRKIKCEIQGLNRACVQCMRRNTKCVFSSRKEKRQTLKRTEYVKLLEERVRRTESILKTAGILPEDTNDHDELVAEDDALLDSDSDVDGKQNNERSFNVSNASRKNRRTLNALTDREKSYFVAPVDQKPIPDLAAESNLSSSDSPFSRESSGRRRSSAATDDLQQVCLFKGHEKDESRYIGRASSLSILSQGGIEWIKSKAGDVSFLKLLSTNSSHDSPWDNWRPDVFHDLFASQVFKPLPPRAEVFALLRDYFRTVNRLFPLYHEGTFMRLVEWQYTQQTCNDAARWASINIMISLAYEYRFSNSLKPERDKERAWLYFKNAMSVFTELTLRRTDLLSVQALLGLALFLRGNSGTQSALPIVTAAVRSCHRMGLHRSISRPNLSAVEQEQRKRVFWIAYFLDQSTCIRAGNAPSQHVDDFDVGLPEELTGDNDGFPEVHPCNLSFFRQVCRLTVIKSRIYSKLYSAKSQQKTPEEVCEAVNELNRELEEWKENHPFDGEVKQRAAGNDFLLGFAAIGVKFVYYNSLIMIHRMPLLLNYLYARPPLSESDPHFDPKVLAMQASSSANICMQAARDTLKLVNNMPWGDIAWIWSMLYYVFLAVMTIFINILRDSKQPKAREDLQSLNMAATFFATLTPADGPCNYARFMAKMCANFERVARSVVDKEEKEIKSRGETGHPEKEQRSSTSATPSKRQSDTTDSSVGQHAKRLTRNTRVESPHNILIPHIEGLPRINSAGYVVPESPSSLDSQTPSSNAFLGDVLQQGMAADGAASNNPSLNNMFSFAENVIPDFWQIPITADWELGSQFLESIHPQHYSQGHQPLPVTTTMAPGSSGMGFYNDNPNIPQGPASMNNWWPDGFMNFS